VPAPWSLIVLAGGGGSRLGGLDKGSLTHEGRTFLQRIGDSVPASTELIVSGPRRPVDRAALFTVEAPAGGGPVAGLIDALAHVTCDRVAVVSVDMPWGGEVACLLVERLGDGTGIVAQDASGHHLLGASAWQTAVLRTAVAPLGSGRDLPMRAVTERAVFEVWEPSGAAAEMLLDIDSPHDAATLHQTHHDAR
jgi:molybdopterin-guanine dinucleotide biosynthesis protein A